MKDEWDEWDGMVWPVWRLSGVRDSGFTPRVIGMLLLLVRRVWYRYRYSEVGIAKYSYREVGMFAQLALLVLYCNMSRSRSPRSRSRSAHFAQKYWLVIID